MINLSPGPAPLPKAVMTAFSKSISDSDLIHLSHRSERSQAFILSLKTRVRQALNLSDQYEVLFLSGSSRESTQRIFRDLESCGKGIDHYVTGYWSNWASTQSQKTHTPAYVHVCLNETIDGIFLENNHALPVIADVTSCIFTTEFQSQAAIWYASGQKIFSMAGFSLCIVDKHHIDSSMSLCQYMVSNSSCVTPPIYGMILLDHFLEWLEYQGGIKWLSVQTQKRSAAIYSILEKKEVSLVSPGKRSATSIVFHGKSPEQNRIWIEQMLANNVVGFKNHSAVGGMRIMNLPGLEQGAFDKLLCLLEALP
jgi:phosphoserine aminotransferase